jgi:CRISPR-associated protein Cas2
MTVYVIAVYDVSERRVAKCLKTFRRYLVWVQNSVFEGELSEAQIKKLQADLGRVLNWDEDSVLFYIATTRHYTERRALGRKKGDPSEIIL